MSKIIFYHGPKTGGTTLSNTISNIVISRNKRICLLDSTVQSGKVRFANKERTIYEINYDYEVDNSADPPYLRIGNSCNNYYRAASFISGHIHTQSNYAYAFANSILTEHSCSNAQHTNSLGSKSIALLTYRNPSRWLNSILCYTYQERDKLSVLGPELHGRWLNICNQLQASSSIFDCSLNSLKAKILQIFRDFKEIGYYTSQAQWLDNFCNSLKLSGSNIYLYSLNTAHIDKFCAKLTSRFLPSSAHEQIVRYNTTRTEEFVTASQAIRDIVDSLSPSESQALDLDISGYYQFGAALASPTILKRMSSILECSD